MRKRVVIAVTAASACIGMPVQGLSAMSGADLARPPASTATPNPAPARDTCNLRQARRFTGVAYKQQVHEDLARAILHNRIRLIRPGAVITQDMRPDRINLILDDAGKIMTIRCG